MDWKNHLFLLICEALFIDKSTYACKMLFVMILVLILTQFEQDLDAEMFDKVHAIKLRFLVSAGEKTEHSA
jgi:hypothetical protein